jgi:hypothetical protein
MTPPGPIIVQKVEKQQLRDIWNEPHFQADLLRQCTQRIDVYWQLAPPEAGQVEGTMSHVFDLVDNRGYPDRRLLGTFHVYRTPEGGIGASGMHDPIFLLVNGAPMTDP